MDYGLVRRNLICVFFLNQLWLNLLAGTLKSLMHGTQHIEKQVINSFSYFRTYQLQWRNSLVNTPALILMHWNILIPTTGIIRYQQTANSKLIASDVYSLGKPLKGTVDSLLDDSEVQALQQVMNVSTVPTEVFSQSLFRNITIHSCQWNKKASSLSSKLPNTATYTVRYISKCHKHTRTIYIFSFHSYHIVMLRRFCTHKYVVLYMTAGAVSGQVYV